MYDRKWLMADMDTIRSTGGVAERLASAMHSASMRSRCTAMCLHATDAIASHECIIILHNHGDRHTWMQGIHGSTICSNHSFRYQVPPARSSQSTYPLPQFQLLLCLNLHRKTNAWSKFYSGFGVPCQVCIDSMAVCRLQEVDKYAQAGRKFCSHSSSRGSPGCCAITTFQLLTCPAMAPAWRGMYAACSLAASWQMAVNTVGLQ